MPLPEAGESARQLVQNLDVSLENNSPVGSLNYLEKLYLKGAATKPGIANYMEAAGRYTAVKRALKYRLEESDSMLSPGLSDKALRDELEEEIFSLKLDLGLAGNILKYANDPELGPLIKSLKEKYGEIPPDYGLSRRSVAIAKESVAAGDELPDPFAPAKGIKPQGAPETEGTSGTAVEEVPDARPAEVETEVPALSTELLKVWQAEGRPAVQRIRKRGRGKEVPVIRGENFSGFVIPNNRERRPGQDRAAFLELADGTKIFLVADGDGTSYYGSLAAQRLVDTVEKTAILESNNPRVIQEMLQDKTVELFLSGELRSYQQALERHFQTSVKGNQSEENVSEWEKRLRQKGSCSTFLAVSVSPQGEVSYLTVGSGVIRIVSPDGREQDLSSDDSDTTLSSLTTFSGRFRQGRAALKPGDLLLFGTAPLRANFGRYKAKFNQPGLPELTQLPQDLTVFGLKVPEVEEVKPTAVVKGESARAAQADQIIDAIRSSAKEKGISPLEIYDEMKRRGLRQETVEKPTAEEVKNLGDIASDVSLDDLDD